MSGKYGEDATTVLSFDVAYDALGDVVQLLRDALWEERNLTVARIEVLVSGPGGGNPEVSVTVYDDGEREAVHRVAKACKLTVWDAMLGEETDYLD